MSAPSQLHVAPAFCQLYELAQVIVHLCRVHPTAVKVWSHPWWRQAWAALINSASAAVVAFAGTAFAELVQLRRWCVQYNNVDRHCSSVCASPLPTLHSTPQYAAHVKACAFMVSDVLLHMAQSRDPACRRAHAMATTAMREFDIEVETPAVSTPAPVAAAAAGSPALSEHQATAHPRTPLQRHAPSPLMLPMGTSRLSPPASPRSQDVEEDGEEEAVADGMGDEDTAGFQLKDELAIRPDAQAALREPLSTASCHPRFRPWLAQFSHRDPYMALRAATAMFHDLQAHPTARPLTIAGTVMILSPAGVCAPLSIRSRTVPMLGLPRHRK